MSKRMAKIAVAVAILAFAACAADSKPAPGTSGNAVPSGSSSSSSSTSDSSSGGPATLSVFAIEPAADTFSFDTAGVESMPAGQVVITFQNLGTMSHELRVMRIRDGNFAAYRAAVVSNPLTSPLLADEIAKSPPIDAAAASTFGAELSSGTYALVCLLTAPDGKVFAQRGMIRELTVTPA
jgi:hypothetical protein